MARAFGKIILAGEHAVVYGYPAIASTLTCEVRVLAKISAHPGLHFPPFEKGGLGGIFDQILPKLRVLLGERVNQLEFDIESDVPAGCGLGSSAALSVALIRSVLDFYGESKNMVEVARMALELEKIFHGNPSGVDHTVIAEEGLIWFQRGVFEHIISKAPMHFVIAIGSPHAGTLKAVEAVRKRYEEKPEETKAIFKEIDCLTHAMRLAIETGDLPLIGQLMNQNQTLLKSLGVSTPELDRLCEIACKHGALGAKLTGAGGGGCVMALTEEPQRVLQGFEAAGFKASGGRTSC